MAHSLSAEKRMRQNVRRRSRNRWRKGQVKQAAKAFEASLTGGKLDQAKEDLRLLAKRLDKIAAKGTIHKNAAARTKSRLAKRLYKASKVAPAAGA